MENRKISLKIPFWEREEGIENERAFKDGKHKNSDIKGSVFISTFSPTCVAVCQRLPTIPLCSFHHLLAIEQHCSCRGNDTVDSQPEPVIEHLRRAPSQPREHR